MGWIPPPDGIAMCQGDVGHITQRRGRIHDRSYHRWAGFGKAGFQSSRCHGQRQRCYSQETVTGSGVGFFADLIPCMVAMETCATAHYWAREINALGHTVRLVVSAYVKPFVKPKRMMRLTPRPWLKQPAARPCNLSSRSHPDSRRVPWSVDPAICLSAIGHKPSTRVRLILRRRPKL